MTDINNTTNLNSHYTSNPKVERPIRYAVSAPQSLPTPHLFNDIDANNRMKAINQDIYQDSKTEKNKKATNFIKIFGSVVLAILAILGIKSIFK